MPERHIFFFPLQKRLHKSVACTLYILKGADSPCLPAPFLYLRISVSSLLTPDSCFLTKPLAPVPCSSSWRVP